MDAINVITSIIVTMLLLFEIFRRPNYDHNLLLNILKNTNKIMKIEEQLAEQITRLEQTVNEEQEQIRILIVEKENIIKTRDQTIIDLQKIIDEGSDPVALQALVDRVKAINDDVESTTPDVPIDPPNPNP